MARKLLPRKISIEGIREFTRLGGARSNRENKKIIVIKLTVFGIILI